MTPFVVGSISALVSAFIALIACNLFDRRALRQSRSLSDSQGQQIANQHTLPWPLFLLRPELWGIVIGTVLMVRYLRSPDHHYLISSALVGALGGVTYAVGLFYLVRRKRAQRIAEAIDNLRKDTRAVP